MATVSPMHDPETRARDAAANAADAAAAVAAPPRPLVHLVLQGSPMSPPQTLSLRIARRLGLDAWGDFLLGRRVAQEMGAAGFVLLVVLTFEFLSWSLLFNILVNSAQWAFTWRTPLACILAGVFAGGVFLFERSFVTADLGEKPLKKALAYSLRLGIIAGSCIATSQPLELLVFGGAIETRLRDENALIEAVQLVKGQHRYEPASHGKSAGVIEDEVAKTKPGKALEHDTEQRNQSELESRELEIRLQKATELVTARDAEVGRRRRRAQELQTAVRRERDPDERAALEQRERDAESAVTVAERRLADARQQKNELDGQLGTANAKLDVAQKQLDRTSTAYKAELNKQQQDAAAVKKEAKDDLEELETWMHDVQNVTPGKALKRRKTGHVLWPKAADFTDRLRVLDDLKTGTPAAWPPANPAEVTEAARLFQLEDPHAPADPVLKKRRKTDSELFGITYRIAFIIAAVIPLLTLAFKLMISQELAAYYSAEAQARGGNPEAIRALQARGVRLEDLARPPQPRPSFWQRLRNPLRRKV